MEKTADPGTDKTEPTKTDIGKIESGKGPNSLNAAEDDREFPLDSPFEEYQIFADEIYGRFLDDLLEDGLAKEAILFDMKESYCQLSTSTDDRSEKISDVLSIAVRVMNSHLSQSEFNYFASFQYNLIKREPNLLTYMNSRLSDLQDNFRPASSSVEC